VDVNQLMNTPNSEMPAAPVGPADPSMVELVLAAIPPAERVPREAATLAERLGALDAAPDLASRLDALVRLVRWTRTWRSFLPPGHPEEPLSETRLSRLHELLDLLERAPAIRERVQRTVGRILAESDALALFAEAGIPAQRGFFAEFGDRLMNKLLPQPRDDRDLAKLLRHLFTGRAEVERFLQLPPDDLQRTARLLMPPAGDAAWSGIEAALADAFRLLAARVQAEGLSEKLRSRSRPGPVSASPFYRLARSSEAVLDAWSGGRVRNGAAVDWRACCAACRQEMAEIHRRLETEGVSTGIVFGLEVLERCLRRMEQVVDVLDAGTEAGRAAASHRLLAQVVLSSHQDRSLVHLVSWNTHLLQRKIVERSGKTGEHYIAANRAEYRHIWLAAAGGGLLTVATAAVKMQLVGVSLAAFQEGFLTGLNYAVSFLLLQVFGLMLATKQPAMTGAKLADIVREERGADRRTGIAAFTARICYSQLAAALGNILLVSAGAVLFSLAWRAVFGTPFLDANRVDYVIDSLNPLASGTVLYAAMTGVILWLASLAGGWFENWVAYHRVPQAIAEHPLGEYFGRERLRRWGDALARGAAGWGTNISLGFMLGYVHGAGRFLGIPMDVRHVTLNTGTLALALTSRDGLPVPLAALLWALAGVAVMFVLNLSVSFLLALYTALRAYSVPGREMGRLLAHLVGAFFRSPGRFILPPRRSEELGVNGEQ